MSDGQLFQFMARSKTALSSLPSELLVLVLVHLDLCSLLSLRLVAKRFHQLMPYNRVVDSLDIPFKCSGLVDSFHLYVELREALIRNPTLKDEDVAEMGLAFFSGRRDSDEDGSRREAEMIAPIRRLVQQLQNERAWRTLGVVLQLHAKSAMIEFGSTAVLDLYVTSVISSWSPRRDHSPRKRCFSLCAPLWGKLFPLYQQEAKEKSQCLAWKRSVFLRFARNGIAPLSAVAVEECETWLVAFARNGEMKEVRGMLEGGVDVNACNDLHFTPLHAACEHGHAQIVDQLLRAGAHIDARNYLGMTPLYFAAQAGQQDVVKMLLRRSTRNEIGSFRARDNTSLLAIKDNSGNSVLHVAAERGHCGVCRVILKYNVGEIEEKSLLHEANELGWTPLHVAAQYGCKSVILLLLKAGADVNAQPMGASGLCKKWRGESPLHCAAGVGYHAASRCLLEHGADKSLHDQSGRSPFHTAARKGNRKVIQLFLQYGTNINERDMNGKTALHYAAKEGYKRVVQKLLEEGASADLEDDTKKTPLQYALEHNHQTVAALLCRYILMFN